MTTDTLNHWFVQNRAAVQAWLRDHGMGTPVPLYFSVDIRDSGHKAAVVDANAFPSGWNNLEPAAHTIATEAFSAYMAQHFPGIQRIGIVPENHTRNAYYFDNVSALLRIVRDAGYRAEVTHVNPELTNDVTTVEGTQNNQVSLLQLERRDGSLVAHGFEPELLLLNNDLSGGIPELLDGSSLPVVPTAQLGWFRRMKSRHFEITNELITEFCTRHALDPWLLTAQMDHVSNVDFVNQSGTDEIANKTDMLIADVARKYTQYAIEGHSCAFIKDNSGTYGQANMHVASSDQVRNLNRKTINKMSVGKGGAMVDDVLIQECIPTRFVTDAWAGEPVLYSVGDTTVGGFARMNTRAGARGNLNARGQYFTTLPSLYAAVSPAHDVYEFLTAVARLALGHELSSQ